MIIITEEMKIKALRHIKNRKLISNDELINLVDDQLSKANITQENADLLKEEFIKKTDTPKEEIIENAEVVEEA